MALSKLIQQRSLAIPLGTTVASFSALALWGMFALKDFSSAVRDVYETPPGIMQYIIFGIVCISFLLLFAFGVFILISSLRQHKDA